MLAKMRKLFVLLFLLIEGCAVRLSDNTCNSLDGVASKIMSDRQAGVSKDEALTKLKIFTSGKPDSKPFYEVASKIIDLAYNEPLGATDIKKAELATSFESLVHNKCLSGEISPTYNPIMH